MKDNLIGVKIFWLMTAAVILCFVFAPWMQYIVMPMLLIMMVFVWMFEPKGDAEIIVFVISITAYYLEMLGVVGIMYWLNQRLIRRSRAKQHPELNVMPENSKEQRDDGDSREK